MDPPSLVRWYRVMVRTQESDLMAEFTKVGAAAFPGSRQAQERPWSVASHSSFRDDGERTAHQATFAADPGTIDSYYFTTVYHSDFDPEWPIATDWQAVIRGLRGSFHMSQARFAETFGLGRATVERWETGRAVPFGGDALQLLTLIRSHLVTPIQAGQALNLAAAVVMPRLTKPTAEYVGRELLAVLTVGKHDHAYLGPGLLDALVTARVLIPLHYADEPMDDTYFPLAARLQSQKPLPGWAPQLIEDLLTMAPKDRELVTDLVARLAR
jgi:transcriptional regulator with XRE-family HTH domain